MSHYEFEIDFARQRFDAGKDGFVLGLVVGCSEGEVKGFFDEDVVGAFQDDTSTCSFWV